MHTPPVRNAILASLSRADFALLERDLEPIHLPFRTPLEHAKKRAKYVYFMESGLASVVAAGDRPIEVGVIGREGMTGVSVILGRNEKAPNETFVQIEGKALRLSVDRLIAAITQSRSLHNSLLSYVHTFLEQATQTAMSNGRGTLEQRLSRWLLMINDRVEGDTVPMTHELLGIMLAVQRTGVTVTLKELERQGAICQKRGAIEIKDRATLLEIAKLNYAKID